MDQQFCLAVGTIHENNCVSIKICKPRYKKTKQVFAEQNVAGMKSVSSKSTTRKQLRGYIRKGRNHSSSTQTRVLSEPAGRMKKRAPWRSFMCTTHNSRLTELDQPPRDSIRALARARLAIKTFCSPNPVMHMHATTGLDPDSAMQNAAPNARCFDG